MPPTTHTDANGNVSLNVQGAAGTDILGLTDGTVKVGTYVDNGAGVPASIGTITNHKFGFFTNNSGSSMVFQTTGNITIGSSTDVASALLSMTSTTKGFLMPVMTGAQAEAISSPATGLLIYANNGNGSTITSTGWWGYTGSAWVKLN